MLRVTADTNTIISGVTFRGGKPFQFLDLARSGQINPTVSDAILEEMEDVLRRKFPFSESDIAETRRRINSIARTVTPAIVLDVVKEDPDDNRILEAAVAAGSDYIVTGDKDLLRLKRYNGIRIVNVSDFLELFHQQERQM